MTSEPARAYVWTWLPEHTEPVVAGVLQDTGDVVNGEQVLAFRYAASYRERADAVSLYTPELPLGDAVVDPRRIDGREALAMPGALRDAAPDAWGRRVINSNLAGQPDVDLNELTYLLESGSDRIGALDFQASPREYVPRGERATLEQLVRVAELIEAGEPVPAQLLAAAGHGTSIGGARPKALIDDEDGTPYIAKFSSSTDDRPVVFAEAVAMLLAQHAGLDVAPVQVVRSAGKDVLMVRRFDRVETRTPTGAARTRRQMVSMLTVLGVAETSSRHESYAAIAHSIRSGPWTDPGRTLREMFARLVFNVLVGNNDDHLRNHAAFWDGGHLALTPAFDLCPQPRRTPVSSQAIAITSDGQRASQLRVCRMVAGDFTLTAREADQIIERVHGAVVDHFPEACDQARVPATERALLWGREFCNEYVFRDVS
ncbi:type II toxin-antitoxin system HipA family toxin [Cellulomonas sp. NPDC057328]|uniref:type II toxin-antitoxin system HipA family toxin n=1 Tax=Cellulomonas sp. NPDC057328 TaxID=3346101 RepID=UPI003633EEEC